MDLLCCLRKFRDQRQKETIIVPVPTTQMQPESDRAVMYEFNVQEESGRIQRFLTSTFKMFKKIFEDLKHVSIKLRQAASKKLCKTFKIKSKKGRFLINRSEKKTKIRSFLSFLIRIMGGTFFFVVLESAFVGLLNAIGTTFYEIWILEISLIVQYAIFVYTTYRAGKSRILKIFKIMTSIFMLFLVSSLVLIIVTYFESLITLLIVLNLLIIYYVINIVLFVKSTWPIESTTKIKAFLLICLTISSSFGSSVLIYFLPNTIEIQPKSEPEIVFLCGSGELPTNRDILEMCKEYNIGFMPTIRDYIVGNDLYMQTYKKVVTQGINLYFLLGGNSNFYAYVDNAEEFPAIYKNISRWFVEEGLMDNQHVRSFSVDAETPVEMLEKIIGDNVSDSILFGYNNYPTLEEIEKATNAYVEFTDLIRRDGKKCGMVHAAKYLDPVDNDGDLSLFARNIYSLDINWNFTIPMIYRTNYFRESDITVIPPMYLEISTRLFYGATIDGTRFTISDLSFYQIVNMEQNSKSINSENQYIVIGNFEKGFKNTKYIQEKEYLKDFDICRHFNKEKVFFYDLQGFLYHYGWEGIKELGRHNQQKNTTYLNYDNYKSFAFLTLYFALILVDIFAFFERELTA